MSVTCFPSECNTRLVQNFSGKELAHQIIDWASEQMIKPGWNYMAEDLQKNEKGKGFMQT